MPSVAAIVETGFLIAADVNDIGSEGLENVQAFIAIRERT
jgi:hypothetical protein